MHIHAFGLTDKGDLRPDNQDAYFIDGRHQCYAVADGLGGLPGGAEASRRIVDLLDRKLSSLNSSEDFIDLAEWIIGINHIVFEESTDAYPITGSGSTLTLCKVLEDQLLIGHVGDSAAYLLRDGDLDKLTIDHTMEQEFVDRQGEEARQHMPPEYPHTLTRCVGQEGELRVDQTRTKLQSGDRILLCTDGLNKVVPVPEIAETLGSDLNSKEICQELVNKANARSGPDNITVITLFLD